MLAKSGSRSPLATDGEQIASMPAPRLAETPTCSRDPPMERRGVRGVLTMRDPGVRPRAAGMSRMRPRDGGGVFVQAPRLLPVLPALMDAGRRMSDIAAHLVDAVLPEVPIRQ